MSWISPCDRGKHTRCDDVVHILMVKFETYQIQMGATISDFMFCTYKTLDALKCRACDK
jgi:hypothetical protein